MLNPVFGALYPKRMLERDWVAYGHGLFNQVLAVRFDHDTGFGLIRFLLLGSPFGPGMSRILASPWVNRCEHFVRFQEWLAIHHDRIVTDGVGQRLSNGQKKFWLAKELAGVFE